ncbi:MAG TPA: hypothetical protein VKB88_36380 [Bryobacteraceae bacterium]|nr:hypothetical protein [Bryobacteraceae bacterium]
MVKALALFALAVAQAGAVELHIQFGALERMLAKQLFTEDGRKYVRGNAKTRCNFAYLEHPQIEGADGLLHIRAKFTGRSALNMLGQCVGVGDAFTVLIAARPQYRDGNVGLASVTATSDGRTGFYIRRVCDSLASSLGRDFRYPLAAEAQKALQDPGTQPEYQRELRKFRVPDIRVAEDALIIEVDFELTVK